MDTSKLQDRRVWLAGGVCAALLIVIISWLFVIHPKLSSASELRSQATDRDSQNSTLESNTAELAKRYEHIDSLRLRLARLSQQLPSDSELPEFTRSVTAAAHRFHLSNVNISIQAPTSVTPAATAAPSTPAEGTSDAATPSAADTATSQAVAVTPTAYSIAVSLQSSGSFANEQKFLYSLQHGSRSALVTTYSSSTDESGKATSTVNLNVFVASMTDAQRKQLRELINPGN